MGDVEVLTSDCTVFAQDKPTFVSPSSYREFTRARKTVIRRAEIKVNTDLDPNGNEKFSESPFSSSINGGSEESSVTVGVEAEKDASVDISESINGKSKEESDVLQRIEEEEITPTARDDLSLSPMAFLHRPKLEGTDEVDGKLHNFVENLPHMASDFVGKVIHDMEGAAKRMGKKQPSVEGLPENNIHLFHHQNNKVIKMGLHIDEHHEGCRIARVIEDSIACRTKLQEDDVIMKINGFSLRCKNIGDIMKHFSEIDITKTFTLTIKRKIETDDDKITFIEIDVHITLTLSENQIGFEVEVLVTAQKLKYQSSTDYVYIRQNPTGKSPIYMRVNGADVCMDTKTDTQSVFRLELYNGGKKGRRICVLRNQPSSQVIDKSKKTSANELFANNAPSPNGQIISSPDSKYFYWDRHPNHKHDEVFESVNKKGYYITATDSNKLVLRKFSSVESITPEARFRVTDVK